jgi:hypothetical protein
MSSLFHALGLLILNIPQTYINIKDRRMRYGGAAMRQFKSMIFLGGGEYSRYEIKKLKKRLEEGLSILSGLQQPPHSRSEEEAKANRAHDREQVKELNLIVKDIAMALTGKKWIYR